MAIQSVRDLVDGAADFICEHQLLSGAIPWYRDGVTDPWDHVECAIALDLCGRHKQASRAYYWLGEMQNPDGSWWYTYQGNRPSEMAKDSNHSAYIATGLWYHYLVTGDTDLLHVMWPVIEQGIEFTLNLQQPTGEIYWARDANDNIWPSALLAASSCIYQSLTDAVKIADVLKINRKEWHEAGKRLGKAIREMPHLFDIAGDNERGYAMNWYYPVLSGVITGKKAKELITKEWHSFMVDTWGCRCSLDQPWVTVAETCELVMALVRIKQMKQAGILLDWSCRLQDPDGGFWTGIRVPEETIYPPGEKTTWTSAAVIMATVAFNNMDNHNFNFWD